MKGVGRRLQTEGSGSHNRSTTQSFGLIKWEIQLTPGMSLGTFLFTQIFAYFFYLFMSILNYMPVFY